MEFFKIKKDIPFMRYALVFNVISLITFILAVFFLITKGLNFDVDFTGGTVMEINSAQPADVPKIRDSLAKLGFRRCCRAEFRHFPRRADSPAVEAGDIQRQVVGHGDERLATGGPDA